MKKIMFFQSEHTLAKLSQNMAFADCISKNGYDVIFACSKRGSTFISENSKYRFEVVPQCWELQADSNFINTWFQDEEYITNVFTKEYNAICKEKPDLVVSNVSYTTMLACRKAGIPIISVIPPLQMPSNKMFHSLFYKKSLPAEVTAKITDKINSWENGWWNNLATPFTSLLKKCGHAPINDVRSLLVGDYQMIYSLPEYDTVSTANNSYMYTGPLLWQGWKADDNDNINGIILCTFGTKMIQEMDLVHKTVEAIRKFPNEFFVVHAKDTSVLEKQYSDIKNLKFIESYNPEKILPRCKAVFCQGGYSLMLLCFKQGIPVLTIPFQLEQMYHAKKMEQKGTGLCLSSMPKIKDLIDNDIGGDVFLTRNANITSEIISEGLDEIINTATYRNTAAEIALDIKKTFGCNSLLNVLESWSW